MKQFEVLTLIFAAMTFVVALVGVMVSIAIALK